MPRLTNHVRERMASDLLKRRFTEAGEELAVRSAELFRLAYESVYDQETRRIINKLKKKFRNGIRHFSTIHTNTGGLRIPIGATTIGTKELTFRATVDPLPFIGGNGGGEFTFSGCEIGTAIEKFGQDIGAFAAEIAKAHSELIGALSSVTTDKQLAELWPEAMPILGQHIPAATGRNLPAVQFSKLSQSFGLPPAEQATDAS